MKKPYQALVETVVATDVSMLKSIKEVRVLYKSPSGLSLFKHVQELSKVYAEFLMLCQTVGQDGNNVWKTFIKDESDALNEGKRIISLFSAVQASARKLAQDENRKNVVQSMIDNCESAGYWSSFPADVRVELQKFAE